MQLEFAFATVWTGHGTVQHMPGIAEQVGCLGGPGHGACQQLAVYQVRLDGADPRGPITPECAQHRYPGVKAGEAQPGDRGCTEFQVALLREAGRCGHGTDATAALRRMACAGCRA